MTLQNTLQLWYLTHYNRAADEEGLTYWLNLLEEGVELDTLHASFTSLEQPEAVERWEGVTDTSVFVTQLFTQLLNRPPSSEEVTLWNNSIEARIEAGGTLQTAGNQVAREFATQAYEDSGDSALLAAKIQLATTLTETLSANNELIAQASQTYLSSSELGQLSSEQLAAFKSTMTAEIAELTDASEDSPPTTTPPPTAPQPPTEPIVFPLDDLESSLIVAFDADGDTEAFIFTDSVEVQSNTRLSNFSNDDALVFEGVKEEDVRVSVFEGNTQFQFDDGAGVVSQVTLVGVNGFFTSVEDFNAASSYGDLTFA